LDCLKEETIEALMAGTLDPEARGEALAHIRKCTTCRESVHKTAVLYRALDKVFAQESREDCPTTRELADYDEGQLDSADKGRIEQHLQVCVRCAADLYELKSERQAFSEAESKLTDQKKLTVSLDAVSTVYTAAADNPSMDVWIRQSVQKTYEFPEVIRLVRFTPKAEQTERLAAATGSGFDTQTFIQGESPFEVEATQFGDELRFKLTTKKDLKQYMDCVVRLTLSEADSVQLTRLILVKNGGGSCILQPKEALACVPDKQPLTVSVEVIDSHHLLEVAKEKAVSNVLINLLSHSDPSVRCSAINLLGKIGGNRAIDAIAKLKQDSDQMVRSAAEQTLGRLTNK